MRCPQSLSLLLLLPLAAVADPAPLAWQASQPEGRAVVRTGYYVNWLPNGVQTPGGDLIVAWADARRGNFDTWAQKVSGSSGELLWGDGSQPLLASGAPDQQAQPLAVTDGGEGAFLVWFDFREGDGGGALYANRVADGSGAGTVLWPQDMVIHGGSHVDSEYISGDLAAVPDGSGGIWIAWTDQRAGNWDLFLARLDANGVIPAPFVGGLPVADHPSNQHDLRLETDGQSGVWLAWVDERNGPDGDIFVEHISPDGTRASGDRGALAGGGPATQQEPALAVGAEGAWLAWTDREGDIQGNLRLQRVNTGLQPAFDSGGLLVRGTAGVRESAAVLCALEGGQVLVGWEDSRNEGSPLNADLYLQRYDSSGQPQLAEGGAVLCDIPGNQSSLQLVRQGTGVLALWQDQRFMPRTNLYAQRLDAAGTRLWSTSGVALLDEEAQTRTSEPLLVAAADGGLKGVWFDEGRGAPGLRTQKVSASGQLLAGPEGRELCWGPAGELHGLRLLNTADGLWSFWIESQTALGNDKLFVQRVDADTGNRLFPGEGKPVAPSLEGRNLAFELLEHPEGGVVIALEVGESYGQRAWLLHLDPAGTVAWLTPATATFDPAGDGGSWQTTLRLARGDTGILLGYSGSWLGQGFHSDLGVNAFDLEGQPLWGVDGRLLTSTPDRSEELEALLSDGDGVLVFHGELQLADRIFHGQRLDASGQPVSGSLVELDPEPARRSGLQALRLADGGVGLVWQVFEGDGRTTLKAMGCDPDLTPRWTQPFDDGVYSRLQAHVHADGWGGLVIGCMEYDAQYNQYAGVRHVLADGSLRWTTAESLDFPREGRESEPATLLLEEGEGHLLGLAMIRNGQQQVGDALAVSAHPLETEDPDALVTRWNSDLYQSPELRAFLELELAPDGQGGWYAGWVEQIRLRTQCCVQPIRNVHLVRLGGNASSVDHPDTRPAALELWAWPNPFNPSTRLAFQLERPGTASLVVYNIKGQQVARLLDGALLPAGTHQLDWNPEGQLASGTYLLHLQADGRSTTRSVLLLR